MKLFEVRFERPVAVTTLRVEDILGRIGRYSFREWQIGQEREDITDQRWRGPSHTWLLSRRQDGVGILQIKPLALDAVIDLVEKRRGTREKREELQEVTHMLNRPGMIHLLLGGRLAGRETRGVHLYKIVCTAKDEVIYPFT
jgi:hypothetical protein